MNLPEVISNLILAQDKHDSRAYAACFSDTAVVYDEGKTHHGSTAIQQWIDKANEKYKMTVSPLDYSDQEQILLTEVSGTFPGSPIVLKYNFEIEDNKIIYLKIIG